MPPVNPGNPPPPRLPSQPPALHANAVTPAPASLSVTTTDRRQSRAFFNAIYGASENVPIDWTGSLSGTPGTSATGAAGTTADAYKAAVQLRINWFRAMAGIPASVGMDSVESSEDQDAALMMAANNALSHTPPSTWLLYTSTGANAAGNSNLALGNVGPDAISYGYIQDFGSNNTALGHRRWILYPQTQTMATGDIPPTNGFSSANATWILDANVNGARPPVRDTYVAWPPPGYVPYQVVFPRWSFSYPGADFSGATVTMTSNGSSVPVQMEAVDNPGYGENTVAWDYNGLDGSTVDSSAPRPSSDTTYQVAVNGVMVSGSAKSFSYSVTVFDPAVAGPGDPPPTVTGPSAPVVGQGSAYSVAGIPAFASGFTYRASTFSAFSTVYGAEGGLQGVVATTSAGYNPVDTSTAASGGASYHLAMPDFTTQGLTLPGEYALPQAPASLSFSSRLGVATSAQTAHVQISSDDGNTWTDVYAQSGSGDPGETSFTTRSLDLSAYSGLVIMVRFTYTYASGQNAYTQTSGGIGWNIDNITLTGVELATVGSSGPMLTGSTFTFTPATSAKAGLQAAAVLFGKYPVSWGPILAVSPTSSSTPPGGNPLAHLANLSVRSTAGTGAQTLTGGFVIGGSGSKNVLVRGDGPALAAFGVTGVLQDPVLSLFRSNSDGSSTLLQSNPAWGGSATLVSSFAQVGAFSLAANSKDTAILTNLGTGPYTAQISSTTGDSGVVLVEVYDADTGTPGARFINLSARSQAGTGAQTLIAGFVVSGTGNETVLIRGVGPGLTQFGVPGVLQTPQLSLYDSVNGTSAVIATNTGWGNASTRGASTVQATITTATAATFSQLGAFSIATNSSDCALVATLPPCSYTAQVTGLNSTTGVALVEIYEVP